MSPSSYFTFHNVSINTELPCTVFRCRLSFTFHNVSINTYDISAAFFNLLPLHSTMFLLIQHRPLLRKAVNSSLHSTMFLLIPTHCYFLLHTELSLHSTMFLLIPGLNPLWVGLNPFTFHNVSINTEYIDEETSDEHPLHSTMFLLIPWRSGSHQNITKLYIPQCFY